MTTTTAEERRERVVFGTYLTVHILFEWGETTAVLICSLLKFLPKILEISEAFQVPKSMSSPPKKRGKVPVA